MTRQDATVADIVETGYFGEADTDEILELCETASSHSQGYLMLPRGGVPWPNNIAWTTNGYLPRRKYICLDATHSSAALAASALLEAITRADEDAEDVDQ